MATRQKKPTTTRKATTARKTTARKSAARKPSVDFSKLKAAIVCDWLTGTGGAERVVLELHRLFPDAPIYTSQYDKNPKIWYGDTWFADADIRTTWLQRLPKRLKKFLPVLRAWSFSKLDLSEYDLVIISSGAEAKAVRTNPDATVVWYCHAPTHYYWSRYNEYMRNPGMGLFNPLFRLALFVLVKPLRKWDYAAAQKPRYVIANSTHIKRDIKKYYERDATVVFPPVDTKRFQPQKPGGSSRSAKAAKGRSQERERFGFVVAGRQAPYKRIDLAVEACSMIKAPLTVIGNGPDHDKLTAISGPSVRFLNRVSDTEMSHHFQLAKAFIFPGVDDFGIVAVEAMSAGTPVIAYKAGGALDYIKPGVTGTFFEEQTSESLAAALRQFDSSEFDSSGIIRSAQKYSVEKFRKNILDTISAYVK
jgi:glycosyltransferase involved in cell wall biosynthesis